MDLPHALVQLVRSLRGARVFRPNPACTGHSGRAVHSELTRLRAEGLRVDGCAHVRVIGMGRKGRSSPSSSTWYAVDNGIHEHPLAS